MPVFTQAPCKPGALQAHQAAVHTCISRNFFWLGSALVARLCSLVMRSSSATIASCLLRASSSLLARRLGKLSMKLFRSRSLATSSSYFSRRAASCVCGKGKEAGAVSEGRWQVPHQHTQGSAAVTRSNVVDLTSAALYAGLPSWPDMEAMRPSSFLF